MEGARRCRALYHYQNGVAGRSVGCEVLPLRQSVIAGRAARGYETPWGHETPHGMLCERHMMFWGAKYSSGVKATLGFNMRGIVDMSRADLARFYGVLTAFSLFPCGFYGAEIETSRRRNIFYIFFADLLTNKRVNWYNISKK